MKLFGSALKKEKRYGRNRKCDVMEEEFWIKPPMAPKNGCKAQRKKLIGDAYGLVGLVRRKSFIYIYSVTPWCLVSKFKFIGAALWIGRVCTKKKFNMYIYSVTPWCLVWKFWREKPRVEICLALLFGGD
jgi:hypothetical protein